MTATHYTPSGGKAPVEIAGMPYRYLKSAHAKLMAEHPERSDEITAMGAEIAKRDAEFAAEGNAPADHNLPPVETPKAAPTLVLDTFEACQARIADLDIEARNWADGTEITNAEQAADVDALISMVKAAIKAAEAVRDAEIEPLNAKIKATREAYYPLVADGLKSVKDGMAVRDLKALLAVKDKWGAKQRAIAAADAQRLRDEAAAAIAEAQALRQAAPDDLGQADIAEELFGAATDALKAAKRVETPTQKGFRTEWNIAGFDNTAGDGRTVLLRHILKVDQAVLMEWATEWARKEIRRGVRVIPGVIITESKVAF